MIMGAFIGISNIIIGVAEMMQDDLVTKGYGQQNTAFGIFFLIIWPPSCFHITKKYARLPDTELSIALMNIFKALPQTLGSILYVSTAAMRCLLYANDLSPIIDQCGNVSKSESRSDELRNCLLSTSL